MLQLDNWQKEVLEHKGNKILATGRQVGKTTICAKDAGDFALRNKDITILMIAPTERQASILFDATLDYLFRACRTAIKSGKDRPTKTKIELKNNSRILCLPCGEKGTGIRGYTIHRLYIDEASRVPDDVFDAVTPSLVTTAGDIILLSTPFGRKGFFWKIWDDKESGYAKFCKNTEDVFKNRPVSAEWTEETREKKLGFIENEKRFKTKLIFQQEYMGEFVEDLMQFFNDNLIKECQKRTRQSVINPKWKYYLGIDVGGRTSESTFEIFGKDKNNKFYHVENLHPNYEMTTMTERQAINLDKEYNFRKIYIDANGIGYGPFCHLLEEPQTKRKTEAIDSARDNINPNTADKERKVSISKNDLYDNCLCMMERGEVELLDDPEIFQSFKSVQFEITDNKDLLIYGDYTHIVEGIIRALWGIKDKSLNPFIF